MSYAIFDIIYGVPLTEEISKKIDELEQDENSEWFEGEYEEDNESNTCGFIRRYSGSADFQPGFCGVVLDGFDECADGIDVSKLNLKPTEEQIQLANDRISKLLPELKALCPQIGVYFIPSSS